MNKCYPGGSVPVPLSKISHALALTIGLSVVSAHSLAQTHITTTQTTPYTNNGTVVIVDPGVAFNLNTASSAPAIHVINGGSVSMLSGSSVNATGSGFPDGILLNGSSFSANGASSWVDRLTADALQLQAGSNANLINTNLTAVGGSGHALLLELGTAVLSNVATITGGTLSSTQAEGILLQDSNANVGLNNVTVSGVNAVHMTAGAAAANILTATGSTLTGTAGSAVLLDGTNNVINLADTAAVSSAGGSVATVSIAGAGNTLNVTGGLLSATGVGVGAGTSALSVNGGIANLANASVVTTGANSQGVHLEGGANVSLSRANVATSGVASHAMQIAGGTSGAPNVVIVDNTTLAAQNSQADLIRVDGGVANITIRNGSSLNTSGNLLNLQSSGGVGSVVKLVADGVNIRGNLISDSASTGRVFLQNGTTLTGMVDPMSMTVDSTSAWNVTADSDLTSLTLNGGTVNFLAPAGNAFKTIVTGSLDGTAGLLSMNTKLGDSASPTDLLHVTGDAAGAHSVRITNAGGRGARTRGDGIRVVQIDGASPADNFKLVGGPLEAGAYEYFLNQGGQNRPSDWYLRSTFRAAVPGYMMTPGLNGDYGYAVIGSLQERIGDFGNLARAEKKSQEANGVWGRIQGSQFNQDAHDNLSTSAHTTFMQFGKDWTLASNPDGGSTHAGATVTLGETNARFYDDLRTVLKAPNGNNTGDVKTRAYSAGGYWTGYQADGSYLDLNGQLTWYQNNYKDIYGRTAANKAVGAALSAEVGKPFAVGGSSLRVEPQAQVTYQYLNSKSFSDYMSAISVKGNHGARGRLGVRLFREMADAGEPHPAAPYLTLDLLRNFLNPATVTVGDDALQANANKTWGEIGTGISGRVSTQGQLSAALKYRHQLSGQGNEGVAGQVAYRYNW